MGIADLPSQVWGSIFGGLLVALLVALRLTDLRRKQRERQSH